MHNIINKLFDRQEPFSIESSTDGETRLTIPLIDGSDGSDEIEIIEDGNYKVVTPSKPFIPPNITTYETEKEVMDLLFKEGTQ